jgi:protein-arginine kinase activator protein McsA
MIDELINTATEEANDYGKFSLTELKKMLGEAVTSENYELAAQIRDEISKR